MGSTVKPDGNVDILIAEDSATQAQRLQHILEQEGYRVIAAANGRLALEAAHRRKPALVISDVVMPGIKGPELVAQVVRRFPNIAVLFVTGYAGDASEAEGFADHELLRKPFTINALKNAIAAALQRKLSAPRRAAISAVTKQ